MRKLFKKRLRANQNRPAAQQRRSKFEMLEQRQMLSINSPAGTADLSALHNDRVFLERIGNDLQITVIGTDKDTNGGANDGRDIVTLQNRIAGLGGSADDIQATLEVLDGLYPLEQDTYDVPTLEAIALAQGGNFLGISVKTGSGDDVINAMELKYHGNTTLDAGDGNDVITGGARNDTIIGGNGDDTINNADRFDDLTNAGGAGEDTVNTVQDASGIGLDVTSDNIEHINGTDYDDKIDFSGNSADVTIDGGAGNDTLTGGSGNDDINGEDGDDTINGNPGNDTLNGGAGIDTINGGDGGDTINGDDGEDILSGDDGNDLIHGGNDADNISGGNDNDTLFGDAGDDVINGDDGNDTLNGGDDNDTLDGGIGADTVNGDAGDDTLIGLVDGASDTYDGGADDDLLDFSADGGVTVNLERGTTSDNDVIPGVNLLNPGDLDHTGNSDSSIEDVTGSASQSNTLIGDSTANRLEGGAQVDTIAGRGGNDRILGGDGDDNLRGEGGDDIIRGQMGNDTIEGDGAFDRDGDGIFEPGDGDIAPDGEDTIYGGGGNDVIWTQDSNTGFPTGTNDGDLAEGGGGNDTITGDDGDDMILGEAGDDILEGLDGNDDINGGAGMDVLTGGLGADVLVGGDDFDIINIELINGANPIIGGLLPDIAIITGSGPDTINVKGVGGLPTTVEEAAATIELDDDLAILGDAFSDYDPSIDNLYFS